MIRGASRTRPRTCGEAVLWVVDGPSRVGGTAGDGVSARSLGRPARRLESDHEGWPVYSSDPRSAFTAAAGSRARDTARTTTTREAPASRTAPIVVRSIPPIANHGFVASAAATRTSSIPAAGLPGFVGVSWTG